jgi:hypothetical protein
VAIPETSAALGKVEGKVQATIGTK